MNNALNNYNTKIIQNTWGSQSEEQQQIITLSVELKKIKDDNIKLSQSVLKKIRFKRNKNSNKDNKNDAAPWKAKRGTGPATKKVDGVKHHWCESHKRRNLHTT